jgi:DNA helicase-2/ATP-dependent DNA helicase PcrA
MSQFVLEALDLPPATPVEALRPSVAERLARNQHPVRQPTAVAPPTLGDRPLTLSFGGVSDYLECPAKYRFGHLIRIPTPVSHQMVYGRALHSAVQAFHRRQMAGGTPMTLGELHAELDAAWESTGFLTRDHEEARRTAARETLERFRAAQLADPATPTAVETEFAVRFGRDRVRGRYDRVDTDASGRVTIVDYKSSDVRDASTASRRARESLQLAIYGSAWEAQHGNPPGDLVLHFLESGIEGHSTPTPRRLAGAAEQVATAADGIRAGRFDANPSPTRCGYCPFREICPDALR